MELPNIRPTKCPTCDGQRRLVHYPPSKLYACGFTSEAYSCPDCLGNGFVLPKMDAKSMAAGDAQEVA